MSGPRKTNRLRPWPQERDNALMDLVSEGWTFDQIAALGWTTRNAAIGRFHRIRQEMGWQAA